MKLEKMFDSLTTEEAKSVTEWLEQYREDPWQCLVDTGIPHQLFEKAASGQPIVTMALQAIKRKVGLP